jgi:hypothetical protein
MRGALPPFSLCRIETRPTTQLSHGTPLQVGKSRVIVTKCTFICVIFLSVLLEGSAEGLEAESLCLANFRSQWAGDCNANAVSLEWPKTVVPELKFGKQKERQNKTKSLLQAQH